MRWRYLAPVAFLAGCQNSSVDQAFIKKAQETAALPECPSTRVLSTWQAFRVGLGYHVIVDFAASTQCMARWKKRLDDEGWHTDIHGWKSDRVVNTTVHLERTSGSVSWLQPDSEPNIEDETAGLQVSMRGSKD